MLRPGFFVAITPVSGAGVPSRLPRPPDPAIVLSVGGGVPPACSSAGIFPTPGSLRVNPYGQNGASFSDENPPPPALAGECSGVARLRRKTVAPPCGKQSIPMDACQRVQPGKRKGSWGFGADAPPPGDKEKPPPPGRRRGLVLTRENRMRERISRAGL